VAVRVKADSVKDEHMIKAKDRKIPQYALIPESRERDRKLLAAPYKFSITLRFHCRTKPEQIEQVREALRWWASFGGLGARTRRGLGAIEVRENGKPLQAVTGEEVGQVGGCLALGEAKKDATSAWESAVKSLETFRQGRDVGRNPGSGNNRPGRSRWPEADQIRRHTGQYSPKHAPAHPVQDAYPRAAFGLPIVFHFKDNDSGDPANHILEPEASDRMASPWILRPYFDGKDYRPMALLLPGWEERVSVLVRFKNGPSPLGVGWPNAPADRQRLANQIEPMQNRGTDVLSAFMKFFQE